MHLSPQADLQAGYSYVLDLQKRENLGRSMRGSELPIEARGGGKQDVAPRTFSSSSYGTYHFESRVFPCRFCTRMNLIIAPVVGERIMSVGDKRRRENRAGPIPLACCNNCLLSAPLIFAMMIDLT